MSLLTVLMLSAWPTRLTRLNITTGAHACAIACASRALSMVEAMTKHGAEHSFTNSTSPGVVALFQPNQHHSDDDIYLEALALALRHEYHAIVDAGLI